MAIVILDGFDKYGPPGLVFPSQTTQIGAGNWNNIGPISNAQVVAGLSNTGYALGFLGASDRWDQVLSRTLNQNYSRLIGGFRFSASLNYGVGFALCDSNTTQCSINIAYGAGLFSFNKGDGTLLQQGLSSIGSNSIHYLEFDISIGTGSYGGWKVWLDGVQILSGTGTTQNSANAYANVVQFFMTNIGNDGTGTFTFDDFYLFDSTTAYNNSVLLSNPVIVTQNAIGDVQKQFTPQGNVVGYGYVLGGSSGAVYNLPANYMYLIPFTPQVNCTANSVTMYLASSSFTANIRSVIYADNSGAPGSLLKSGPTVQGFTAGQFNNYPLSSGLSLTAGVQYWFGVMSDTFFSMVEFNSPDTLFGAITSVAFSGGAPATAPAMTYNQASCAVAALCTGGAANYASIDTVVPLGDESSVASSSVGQSDLYVFPAVPVGITTVYAVGVSANCRLTYPGVRKFNLAAKSGGVTSNGSNTNLNPTLNYAWFDSYFPTDPNTAAPWTPTAVSAASFGMSISA